MKQSSRKSIRRPLAGRTVLCSLFSVLSAFAAFGVHAEGDKGWSIGGGEIYRQAIGKVDRMYITLVHCTIEDADTFFPEISPEEWKEETRSGLMHDLESGLDFEFATYIKRT